MTTFTTVRVLTGTASSGKAAVTVTVRTPTSSAAKVCAPEMSGSRSTVNATRCGVSSASVRVTVLLAGETVNPSGWTILTVIVSEAAAPVSSSWSAVPDRLKTDEPCVSPAGMITEKSGTG